MSTHRRARPSRRARNYQTTIINAVVITALSAFVLGTIFGAFLHYILG